MFLKLLLLVALVGITMAAPHDLLVGPVNVQEEWTKWKTAHNKVYGTPEEETKRLKVFEDNLNKIIEHNKKYQAGEVTWTQGLNQFADLPQEEFAKIYLNGVLPPKDPKFVGTS